MALIFVRLKLRLMVNGLRGRPARTVLFVLGVLGGGLYAITAFALFALPGVIHDHRAATVILPLGGAMIMLGWLFLPLVFFGVDESLDPARFALFPLRRRTLITGVFVAALAGVPAISTLAATSGMISTAARIGGAGAALVEALGVLCGLALCVAVSRAVTSAFAGALRSRRSRDLATLLLAVTAALLGPLQLLILALAQHANWHAAELTGTIVGWTPLGAAYSMGLDLPTAPLKFLLVAGSIALLLRWWASTLERAMSGVVPSGRRASRSTSGAPVRSLMLPGLPHDRFGGLVSRELRYWWRENRRRAALVTFAFAGIFLPVALTVAGDSPGSMVVFVGALSAISLANQFGMDGSAYATHILAGIPGRIEAGSRATAHAITAIPLLLVVSVTVGLTSGHPAAIPSTFGTLLATYGVSLALVLPISVIGAYALPQTSNPFTLNSGGGVAKGLLTLVVLVGALVGAIPMVLLEHRLGGAWTWAGFPSGLAYGVAFAFAGTRSAGRLIDTRMPELLAAVRSER